MTALLLALFEVKHALAIVGEVLLSLPAIVLNALT